MRYAMLAAALCAAPLPALAACPTYSSIEDVGTVSFQQNTMVTVPPTGGAHAGAYTVVQLQVLLPTSVKEATGNTIYVEADISTDGGTTWNFAASIPWVSYGGPFTVNLPCQGNVLDPDPTLTLPLNGKTNAIYRLQYKTNIASGHPVFNGLVKQ